MTASHVSVMVPEVMAALALRPGMLAVDGTLGLAGHASHIAKEIAPDGVLIGLDWDESMLKIAEERLKVEAKSVKVRLFHVDYRDLRESLTTACTELGRPFGADAILLDLGLNNAQIEDPDRGISFRFDGPLDMRMDKSAGEPASATLNRLSVGEIEQLIWDLGDERWARKIAQVIVERRKTAPLRTTFDLVDCVLAAIPAAKRDKRIHPATKVFQAVRIYVNRELDELEEAVKDAAECLLPDGTIAVLSYHSGEDRAVKRAFRSLSSTAEYQELYRKPLTPGEPELKANPKSRSAKLRGLRRKSLETKS